VIERKGNATTAPTISSSAAIPPDVNASDSRFNRMKLRFSDSPSTTLRASITAFTPALALQTASPRPNRNDALSAVLPWSSTRAI